MIMKILHVEIKIFTKFEHVLLECNVKQVERKNIIRWIEKINNNINEVTTDEPKFGDVLYTSLNQVQMKYKKDIHNEIINILSKSKTNNDIHISHLIMSYCHISWIINEESKLCITVPIRDIKENHNCNNTQN